MAERGQRNGGRRFERGPAQPPAQPAPALAIPVETILQNQAQDIDESARKIAEACRDLPRTQMRNFYGPIVRLRSDLSARHDHRQLNYPRALFMHAARLSYMAARNEGARPLYACFDQLVRNAVKNNQVEPEKLRAICDFAEAVVAYHYRLAR